jgi:hypothetical protein
LRSSFRPCHRFSERQAPSRGKSTTRQNGRAVFCDRAAFLLEFSPHGQESGDVDPTGRRAPSSCPGHRAPRRVGARHCLAKKESVSSRPASQPASQSRGEKNLWFFFPKSEAKASQRGERRCCCSPTRCTHSSREVRIDRTRRALTARKGVGP